MHCFRFVTFGGVGERFSILCRGLFNVLRYNIGFVIVCD